MLDDYGQPDTQHEPASPVLTVPHPQIAVIPLTSDLRNHKISEVTTCLNFDSVAHLPPHTPIQHVRQNEPMGMSSVLYATLKLTCTVPDPPTRQVQKQLLVSSLSNAQTGEKYPIYIRRDFQITNAALGEELASTDGRSVVKVTHNPINPALFDDDSDSEFDSELEDEFELDEEDDDEEMADGEAKIKAAVEGGAAAADEDDDEEDEEFKDDEDDEEDESDDTDFDDDEDIEETVVICALTAGKVS